MKLCVFWGRKSSYFCSDDGINLVFDREADNEIGMNQHIINMGIYNSHVCGLHP